jgi:uncharacterized protein YndB with AHSA1/START domain
MPTLEASILIKSPIEEVFNAVTDFKQHPKWRGGLIKAEITSLGPLGVDTTYTYNMKVMGREIETTGKVVNYMPPTFYEWQATSGPFPLRGKVVCEAHPDGTKVTETVIAEPGGFFKLAESILLRQQKGQMQKDLNNLMELLEKPVREAK